MRLSLVVVFALCIVASFGEVPQEDGVYVLDNSNFHSWLQEQEFALVEFYAPWCGHCKNLAPHYAEAAQQLAGSSSAVLAKVDATESPDLGQEYGVRGYPTLFWFTKENNYEATPYSGPREAAGIVQWVSKQTKNSLDTLATQEDLQQAITDNSPNAVVVLYGSSDASNSLLALDRSVNDIAVFQVSDEGQFAGKNNGDIVIYPSHIDPVTVSFTTQEELFNTILRNAYPPVVPFDGDNFQRLAQSKEFVVVAVDDLSDSAKLDALVALLNEVSGRDSFGLLYGDSNQLARGIQGAGASGNVFPTLVAINAKTNTQMAFDENLEFNAENVGKWLDGLLDGTTTPFKKSEPVPENNNGPVTTLVAKNFDMIQGKAAFVKYYAPWCGHCKTLAPVWEELGEKFVGKNVVIAKIDATANYVAEQVQGFPTLIWYDQDGNKETYDGGRDLESLAAFVSSKLGHSHDEL